MNVFELFATLSLDTSEYDQGLDDAEKSASSFSSKLKNGLGTAGKVAGIAIGAVTAAAGAVSAVMISGAKQTAAFADNIDKMSQKMGISATAYQEWDAVLRHSGTSIDSMSRGMLTLQKNAANNAEKFKALGISQQQLASMSTEELFAATIEGLQNIGEGAERTALASELLGGSAKELGALLNTSAEETQAMKDRVHELGAVLDDEAVKAGAAFQDQLQDMQTALSGLKNNLMSQFLPSLTTVMGGLTDIFAGNDDKGIPAIEKGLNNFINKLASALPRIMNIAGRIIKTLADAIVKNAPMLIQAAVDIIQELAKGIIDNLPEIAKAAIEIILTLANSIADSLPELVPTIVDVILQIVETLLSNLDKVIEAGVNIIIGLVEGIVNALPKIIEKGPEIVITLVTAIIKAIPKLLEAGVKLVMTLIEGIFSGFGKLVEVGAELISKVWEGFKDAVGSAFSWGADLIKNFISGIFSGVGKLWDGIKSIAGGIADFLGFSEPEKGPLSNFHTFAPDMMKLFAQGIKDNENLIYDQIEDSFDIADKIGDMDALGITTDSNNTINHTGTVRIEGVNNEGEFVAASEYVIEDILTHILSRQARLA